MQYNILYWVLYPIYWEGNNIVHLYSSDIPLDPAIFYPPLAKKFTPFKGVINPRGPSKIIISSGRN